MFRFLGWGKTHSKPGPAPAMARMFSLTASSSAAVAFDRKNNTIAYPSNRVVVLYNHSTQRQTHISDSRLKKITCLAFSFDGKYLATGEEGHDPKVRVWNVKDKTLLAELNGHKNKVSCVGFHPNGKYVVSVGCQYGNWAHWNDGNDSGNAFSSVHVWNWEKNVVVESPDEGSEVLDLACSEDGNIFITVGRNFVKFWHLTFKTPTDVSLVGEPAELRKYPNHTFCSVSFCQDENGTSQVFCVSKEGYLFAINEQRMVVRRWKVPKAYSLRVLENHVYVGCTQGNILIFSTKRPEFLGCLPFPDHTGTTADPLVQSNGRDIHTQILHPDVIALAVNQNHVCAIYSDNSLYVWNVMEPYSKRDSPFDGWTNLAVDIGTNPSYAEIYFYNGDTHYQVQAGNNMTATMQSPTLWMSDFHHEQCCPKDKTLKNEGHRYQQHTISSLHKCRSKSIHPGDRTRRRSSSYTDLSACGTAPIMTPKSEGHSYLQPTISSLYKCKGKSICCGDRTRRRSLSCTDLLACSTAPMMVSSFHEENVASGHKRSKWGPPDVHPMYARAVSGDSCYTTLSGNM